MTLYAYAWTDAHGAERFVTGFKRGRSDERPLIFAELAEARELRNVARAKARAVGRPVRLVVFESSTTLETFEP
jgi:hypothetical protein